MSAKPRTVDAALPILKLLEQSLEPETVSKAQQHFDRACPCHAKPPRFDKCVGRRLEWEVYTPLRIAVSTLANLRYQAAIPLLARSLTESPDVNGRVECAHALNRITEPPQERERRFAFGGL